MWEKIDTCTHRMKVYGGWVLRCVDPYSTMRIALIFIADPGHDWALPPS